MQLPNRCLDPDFKLCQECPYGHNIYSSDDVECYNDIFGTTFDTFCILGFDNGRHEDKPTFEEMEDFKLQK